MNTESKINHRLLGYLFTPSWLSGIFCATTALIMTAGTIAAQQYNGSNSRDLYDSYQANHPLSQPVGFMGHGDNSDTLHRLISSAPLLVFWALIGVVVYLLATNLIGAFQKANELTHELEYVNGSRRRLMITVLQHFLVRCAVVAVWLPYILFFFHRIIPYVLTAATAGGLLSLDGALGAFLSVVVMAAALHVHIFLLRVLLLRPRVFSRALYVS